MYPGFNDLGDMPFSIFKNILSLQSLNKPAITITGFLTGCLAGAFVAKSFGLYVLITPD